MVNMARTNVTSTRGVRLPNNDFGSLFGQVLQKNCGFWFGWQELSHEVQQINNTQVTVKLAVWLKNTNETTLKIKTVL